MSTGAGEKRHTALFGKGTHVSLGRIANIVQTTSLALRHVSENANETEILAVADTLDALACELAEAEALERGETPA